MEALGLLILVGVGLLGSVFGADSGHVDANGDDFDDDMEGTFEGDTMLGFGGDDVLRGNEGDDVLDGGMGEDELYGDGGDDQLIGGADVDWLFGGDGADELYGDDGSDELIGGGGDDMLDGGDGADVLFGGLGNDQLIVGSGDTVTGGSGADVFNIAAIEGPVGNVVDFDAARDRLTVRYGTGAEPLVTLSDFADGTGSVIMLDGVAVANVAGAQGLNADDVILLSDNDDAQLPAAPLQTYRSGSSDGYNIDVEFIGDWDRDQQEAVVRVTDFLSEIVLADTRDTGGVDDLRVRVELGPIDGDRGTLGWAQSDGKNAQTGLSYMATMRIDSADIDDQIANDTFDALIMHEMLHAMGFDSSVLAGPQSTGSIQNDDLRFTGANAMAAYANSAPEILERDPDYALGVPVETHGGGGTRGHHWDEHILGDELMTGYQDSVMPLSMITIAALEDMGYDTVLDDVTRTGDRVGDFTEVTYGSRAA